MTNNLLNRLSSRVLGQAPQVLPRIQRAAPAMPEIGPKFLTDILDAMDNVPETKRVGTGEGEFGHYTHVSSLIGACARMHALAALDDRRIIEQVTGGHRVMWAIGRFVEQHIRGQYLKSTNRRMAFGKWTCACETTWHTGHHPVTTCPRCGQGLDHYRELTLFDHDNWIKGNPDLLVALPGDWIMPVEVKSMTPNQFKDLEAPKGDHVFQLGHYHRMLELEGYRTYPKGVVIYCTKEFKHGSPYKEFQVDMNADVIQNVLADSVQTARALRRTREEGVVPERTLCADHTTTRAKNCPFVVSCFSRR